jgi:hypothetical protein
MATNRSQGRIFRVFGMFALLVAMGFGSTFGTDATAAEPIGPKLTNRLQQLLSEEMQMIRQASRHIMDGLISGDHALVASMAKQIENGFILDKELTDQDKADLMAAAPQEFLEMDGRFHELAGKLSHAGQAEDRELQLFYFNQMMDGCMACHGRFATNKFPAFAGVQPSGHSH